MLNLCYLVHLPLGAVFQQMFDVQDDRPPDLQSDYSCPYCCIVLLEEEKTTEQKERADHLLKELLELIDERDRLEKRKMDHSKM